MFRSMVTKRKEENTEVGRFYLITTVFPLKT